MDGRQIILVDSMIGRALVRANYPTDRAVLPNEKRRRGGGLTMAVYTAEPGSKSEQALNLLAS